MKGFFLGMSMLVSSVARSQSLEAELDSIMRRHFRADSPGGALLVRVGGKTLYQKGYGRAEWPSGATVTPATNFRMASVSKQFTAMAVLLLAKQGKLSVDDNLLRFFPDFNRRVGEQVTLRHLLTHTSGLIDYETLLPADRTTQVSDAEVLKLVRGLDSTYFEPGILFRYSNTGFCLLEQVVERVSQQPYAAFLKQALFDPLGMTNTRLYEPSQPIPNRAMGYALDGLGKIRPSDQSVTSATKGDGCIYTSLVDYQKWLTALDQNRLLNLAATLDDVRYPLEVGEQAYYGLGWFQYRPQESGAEYFHSGSTCGFSTFVVRVPSRNLAVVLFSNQAENTQPFAEVLELLTSRLDEAPRLDVWTMHSQTR